MDFFRTIFAVERQPGYSIAVLLDDEHDQVVRAIWREIQDELGIKHVFKNPIPHITHIQAAKVKETALQTALTQFAAEHGPFTVRTAGLGLFTGPRPAIYIPCVRNPIITGLHSSMIVRVSDAIEGIRPTHHINSWVPHITLLLPDMVGGRLLDVVALLAQRDFTWEMRLNRLIVLHDDENSTEPLMQIELTGTN